jgi:hypothetical protein
MDFVQVPVMSVHEIHTAQPALGIRVGGTVMLVGLLAIVGTLASSLSRSTFATAHGVILALACVGVIAGLVMCAASHVTGRNATLNRDLAEHADVKNAELAMQVEQLTSQVEACNYVLRQLSAAPTVRLYEVSQALERISRDGVQEIAEHIDKVVERAVQELAGAQVAASQREAVDGLANMDDMRLLKRIDEKVRRANGQDT